MRALRFLSVLVAALAIVPALTAPAQAAPPDHTTMQIQGMGATSVYPTPSGNGAWYVNFGVGSYTLNGERTPEQPAVSAGIFDSSCSADGLSCTGYGVDAITPVPAGAFTIEPDLSAAVLPPTEVTGHGWASSWWFDPVLGEWQSETHEISITTTVSASFVATGRVDTQPYHEVLSGDGSQGGLVYRDIISDVTVSRPATATATAFDLTSSDPAWAWIAQQSSTNISTYWTTNG